MKIMNYVSFVKNAQAIFESFPNELVWLQGGVKPNRQLQKPEAGYCIVLRHDKITNNSIAHFMTRIYSILSPVVKYSQKSFHTTIGTYGKGDLAGFVPELETLQYLARLVEKGIENHSQNLRVEFGKWLFNNEAIILSAYPNEELWQLFQNIGKICQENGYPLEMSRITHITTARFLSSVSPLEFEQFVCLMKSMPMIAVTKPYTIDVATWRCDGLTFDITTYKSYCL